MEEAEDEADQDRQLPRERWDKASSLQAHDDRCHDDGSDDETITRRRVHLVSFRDVMNSMNRCDGLTLCFDRPDYIRPQEVRESFPFTGLGVDE